MGKGAVAFLLLVLSNTFIASRYPHRVGYEQYGGPFSFIELKVLQGV